MKKRLVSMAVALCLSGLLAAPAMAAEPAVLLNKNWEAGDTSDPVVGSFSEAGTMDAEHGGLDVAVGKAMNYYYKDNGSDTKNMLETVEMCLTPMDTDSVRVIQAFYDAGNTGLNKNLIKFDNNANGYVLGQDTPAFSYTGGHKYRVRIEMRLMSGAGTITVTDESDSGREVYSNASISVPFNMVFRYKINFEQLKSGASSSKTYMHSLKLTQAEEDGIVIVPMAVGMPPYTAGDSVLLRLEQTGSVPERVTAYADGVSLGEKTAPPFEWMVPSVAAGTHRLFAVAQYAGGKTYTAKGSVTAKDYEQKTLYYNSPMENGDDIKKTESTGPTAGTNGGTIGQMPVSPSGNCLTMFPQAETGDQNFNISSVAAKAEDANLIIWESDMMLAKNHWEGGNDSDGQMGVEVKVVNKDGAEVNANDILIKFRKDGNIYFVGTTMTVPYEANTLYRVKIQLDMSSGKYNIIVADPEGPVFSGYNLVWFTGGSIKQFNRFKCQQNAASTADGVGSYHDNVKIYTMHESGGYIDLFYVRKNGAPVLDLSEIRQGEEIECRASVHSMDSLGAAGLVFAVRDASGKLTAAATAKIDSPVNAGASSAEVGATITAPQDFTAGTSIVAYAWDGVDTLRPLAAARDYGRIEVQP